MTTQNAHLDPSLEAGRNPIILIGGAIVLIGALVLLLFGGAIFSDGAAQPEQTAGVAEAQTAAVQLPESGPPLQVGDQPYEFALQDLQGDTIALSQLIGRPILVNFWATWCGPCRIEMPEIQAAFERHKDDGFVVLALDQDETAEEVEAYFQELGLTFTPLLDVDSDTATNFGLRGTLPASVFINPDGEVTAIHRGVMTGGQLADFLALTIPGLEQS